MQSHDDPSNELGRSVTLFPDPADVFAEAIEAHLDHLHPVASVDLALLDDSLSGVIHLVSPVEPYDGYPGDHVEACHSEFLGPNWIAFHMENGRFRLSGDVRYFFLENDKSPVTNSSSSPRCPAGVSAVRGLRVTTPPSTTWPCTTGSPSAGFSATQWPASPFRENAGSCRALTKAGLLHHGEFDDEEGEPSDLYVQARPTSAR